MFRMFFFFRSKRSAVRIPEASNRKLKAPHRREREQAPHLQTPGANSAENGSAATATTSHNQRGLTLPHTDGHTLHDYRWRNPTQGGPGRIPVHMTGSFAEPDCTALHCSSLPLAQRPKKGTKPKRTQRPKRARSRKGWPNSKKGRQRSQRPQTDQSTTQATLPRRKP